MMGNRKLCSSKTLQSKKAVESLGNLHRFIDKAFDGFNSMYINNQRQFCV